MGRLEAAILTSYLLAQNEFRVIGLCGIAGALSTPDDNHPGLGDVVFAETIVDLEMSKISDAESYAIASKNPLIVTRPRLVEIRHEMSEIFKKLLMSKRPFFHKGLDHRIDSPSPRGFLGSLVSSNSVVASLVQRQRISSAVSKYEPYTKPIAVEMESYGVAAAAREIARQTPFFTIKAISDLADSKKSDDEQYWRGIACDNSAIATKRFLEEVLDENR
jgi:nucleoside phosphorylase